MVTLKIVSIKQILLLKREKYYFTLMEGTSRPEIEFRITQDQVFRSVSLLQIYLHIRTKEVSKHNTITWISENAIVFYGRLILFFSPGYHADNKLP